eukprot:scaffold20120_cov34-Prasinocladus_malaysianus.AAC.2
MEAPEDLVEASENGSDKSSDVTSSFEEGYEPAGIKDEPAGYKKAFVTKRLMVFAGLVIGYASFYITRNSFIYTAPVMVDAGVISMTQVRHC